MRVGNVEDSTDMLHPILVLYITCPTLQQLTKPGMLVSSPPPIALHGVEPIVRMCACMHSRGSGSYDNTRVLPSDSHALFAFLFKGQAGNTTIAYAILDAPFAKAFRNSINTHQGETIILKSSCARSLCYTARGCNNFQDK